MAEDLHDDTLIDALGQQQGGRGVAGVMDPHLADPGRLQQGVAFVPVSVVTDWPAVGLAPDEVAIVPGWPGGHAFVKLGGPVRFEGLGEWGRERDGAPALVGLELGEVEPAAGSLRARPGVPGAAGRAVIAMVVLAAGVGVGAAVLPGEALELPADGQRSGVQVDVLSAKTKGFTLAQPKSEGDAPAGAIALRCGEPDDAQRLVGGQWLDFVVAGRGSIDQGGDVARHVAALHGDLQGAGQDAVNLEHGRRGL